MKLLFITPGTGSYHCGVCMKDNALVLQLRRMGHDTVMLPMYLPQILDEEPADEDQPIFFGGINAYLQLKYSFFRHVPKWLDKVLDSRPLLGKVAKAQASFVTATRLDPARLRAWVNLGDAFRALTRRQEARRAYIEALRSAPGNPRALRGLQGL